MKKAAFTVWMDRIAPVMDVAGTICIVEAGGPSGTARKTCALPGGSAPEKALFLGEMGVDVLVCGAVSKGMLRLLGSQGITVIPFVAGDLDTVVQAWLEGRLPDNSLLMPGCGGSRGFGRGGRCPMGAAHDRMMRSERVCVCTRCGHRIPHERGRPCAGRRCPVCGSRMAGESERRQ